MSYERPPSIPVCERCRRRKQKCESELLPTEPITKCEQCRNANVECTFYDPVRQIEIPRTYVQKLEERRELLRKRLSEKRGERGRTVGTDLNADNNTRYLGASSGIPFIRLAMKRAASEGIALPMRKPTNDTTTSNDTNITLAELVNIVLPLPEAKIPSRPVMERLVEVFISAQSHAPILSRLEIDGHLDAMYQSPKDMPPNSQLVVHILLAISILNLARNEGSTAAESLAENHFECALKHLPTALVEKDLNSVQALLLVLQFLLINPQRPIVWFLIGHALRLATSLGLHKEDSIGATPLDSASLNQRRNLFWCLYSTERATGHTLGRPTGLEDKGISMPFPLPLSEGMQSSIRSKANHRFAIRRLQSESTDILYQRTQPFYDGFIQSFQCRLDEWHTTAIAIAGDDQNSKEWFLHAYHNLTTYIHRPSPANPQPSHEDFQYCFRSSSAVIRIYGEMNARKSIESTWMAVHWLFLAAITNLFVIWVDTEIRNGTNWLDLNDDIHTVSIILTSMAEKWDSARGTLDIYTACARGTLRKYLLGYYTPKEEATTAFPTLEEEMPFTVTPGFMQDVIMDEASLQQYALFSEMPLEMFGNDTAPHIPYNFG